jgi:hypothetical protein
MLEVKKLCGKDLRKLVDVLWATAVVSTLAYGTVLLFIFAISLAIDYKLISIPKTYCHYLSGNQRIDDWCK